MKLSEEKELFTRNGWERLHGRLEKDGLLTGSAAGLKPVKGFTVRARIITVAAVAAACLAIAAVLLVRTSGDPVEGIRTLSNGTAAPTMVQTLGDGSVVYLAGGAEISMPENFASDMRKVSISGSIYFEVEGNKEKPFLIDAGVAMVEVIGTRFDVRTGSGGFSVSVDSGEVLVLGRNGEGSISLHAGETATITNGEFQKRVSAFEPAFAHYIGYIDFKDHPLDDFVSKVNELFPDTEVRLSPEVGDRHFTVGFHNDSPQRMVELVCAALDLECSYEGNVINITDTKSRK